MTPKSPTMRMRDSPDYLTARAANPRTGMISPSLAPSSPISVRTPETPAEALRVCIPSKNVEALRVTIPGKGREDQFVVRMPTAREPQPYAYPGFSGEDIQEFERRRLRALRTSQLRERWVSHIALESADPSTNTTKPGSTTPPNIIARRPVASPLQPLRDQPIQSQPRSHSSFWLSTCSNFVITTLTSVIEAIRIICREDDSTPQQRLTGLKTGLLSASKIVAALLITWYVGSILVHILEMLLWPLLVVFGVFKVSR